MAPTVPYLLCLLPQGIYAQRLQQTTGQLLVDSCVQGPLKTDLFRTELSKSKISTMLFQCWGWMQGERLFLTD